MQTFTGRSGEVAETGNCVPPHRPRTFLPLNEQVRSARAREDRP
jgi:hypothetical protein